MKKITDYKIRIGDKLDYVEYEGNERLPVVIIDIIFDIITDLLRYDLTKDEAIEKLMVLHKKPLNDEKDITFTEWLTKWNWEQVGNSYIFKRGESYIDAETLMKSYKKEYNL